MKAFQFEVWGDWAHFKKPETNNNPLSHDLITKTALIGMIGAVLGIERGEMKRYFPELSESILYGVQLLNPVKKVSWGFTSRTAINPTAAGTPKYFEFLKNPKFKITLALKDEESKALFDKFIFNVKHEEAVYPPVLGWHNCPTNLKFISEGILDRIDKKSFETTSFVSSEHKPKIGGDFRIGFDKLPTYQNDDFWNLPDKYIQIIYPDYPNSITVEGSCFFYKNLNGQSEYLWLM